MLVTLLGLVASVLFYSLLGLLLAWCWYKWSHRHYLRQAEKLPSIFPRLPFIGSIHIIKSDLVSITDLVTSTWRTAIENGYSSYCYWLGPVPHVITQDPEHVRKLLNTSSALRKGFEMENSLNPFFEEGILIAQVDRWKVTRRSLNPVFHPRNLEPLVSVFNDNCRELVQNLSEHVEGAPFDIFHPLMGLALKSICSVIFGQGVEINTKTKSFQGLLNVIQWITEMSIVRTIKFWLKSSVVFQFLYSKEMQETQQIFRNFTDELIKTAKENCELKNSFSDPSITRENNTNPPKNANLKEPQTVVGVYSRLQESMPFITERSLHHEIFTFFTTGTDTIASTVASCLLAAAYYQDIQDQMYKEIMTVVGPDKDVTNEDLKKLSYLEKVFKETLRYFTIVPFVSRTVTEEYNLGPCIVMPGSEIFLCLAGIHLNPKIYPDPLKFDPERFSNDKDKNTDSYIYIPFSGGPRNCIGKSYSYMLMKIILVHILRKYKLSTNMNINKLKRKFAIILLCSDGYNVSLERR